MPYFGVHTAAALSSKVRKEAEMFGTAPRMSLLRNRSPTRNAPVQSEVAMNQEVGRDH